MIVQNSGEWFEICMESCVIMWNRLEWFRRVYNNSEWFRFVRNVAECFFFTEWFGMNPYSKNVHSHLTLFCSYIPNQKQCPWDFLVDVHYTILWVHFAKCGN